MTLKRFYWWPLLWLFICHLATAEDTHTAAIASAHPLATRAGFEILDQGGNAFDAAIAVSAALAVVEPAGSGIGGGGFWLLHRHRDHFETMIDGREMAPKAAHRDMYLDHEGNVDKTRSLDGPLAAAIPGLPAALDHLSQQFGVLPLAQTLAPAIRYAQQGFSVTRHYQKLAQFRMATLSNSPTARMTFLVNGQVPRLGSTITQPDLAKTLQQIARHGRAGFYQGDVAEKLVNGVRQAGGIWTLQDLRDYQIKRRQPIIGKYQGYTITSSALPSSGGIVLMSILNQLESLGIADMSASQKKHVIIEAMRRAYFDRSRYLGDADFVPVPTAALLSKTYGQQLALTIDQNKVDTQKQWPVPSIVTEGQDTSHFSIIDQYGNRVAATLSINYPFGSGFIPEGTGVILNNEMDDFSAQEGAANVYGLIGYDANAIASYKRPLSSMTPTFIENDDRLMLIGTPGGSRIISMVLLGVLDFVDGKQADSIVATPRYHHQYSPNAVQIESKGFNDQEIDDLQQRGHIITRLNRQYGNMQVVIQNKHTLTLSAASDPRGEGEAIVRRIPHQPQ